MLIEKVEVKEFSTIRNLNTTLVNVNRNKALTNWLKNKFKYNSC